MRLPRRSMLLLPGMATLLGPGCAFLADAGPTSWGSAAQFDIVLRRMSITPQEIVLRRGAPVRLHLVNDDSQSRGFYAPSFFANVATRPGEGLYSSAGGIELPPGATRSLVLVPLQAGRWAVDSLGDLPPGGGATIIVTASSG